MKNLKIGAFTLATLLLVSVGNVYAEETQDVVGQTCSNWGAWTYNSTTEKNERTCADADKTDMTESVDHVHNFGDWSYNSASGKDMRTCSNADANHTEEREHIHTYGEWIYNSTTGKDERTCKVDATHKEEREHVHSYSYWQYDEATGKDVRVCTCGEKEYKEHQTDTYIPTIDTKEEAKTVTVGVATDKTNADRILRDSLAKAKGYDANKKYNIDVYIENETKYEDKDYGVTLKTTDVLKIQNALKKDHSNAVIGSFFNIVIYASPIGNGDSIIIEELTEKLTFNVAIPNNLKEVPAGYQRVYYIVRIHGDSTEILNASVQADGTLAFESDKFSTYAIAYEDVKVETSVPKTYDSVDSYKVLGSISVMGLIGTGLFLNKKKFN